MRTTLIRLERQHTEDVGQALEQLQRHFEDLSAALIDAGRKRGYLGVDPMGALAHLCAPATEDLQLTRQIADLWRTFFAGFREDEQAFEAARFQTEAAAINERLQLVPVGQTPDLALAMDMLDTLIGFWDERQRTLSERIDQLIAELTQRQQQLGSAELDRAYQQDELERSTTLVRAAVADLGEDSKDKSLSQLLGALVKRWRNELAERKKQVEEARRLQASFLKALGFAASGKVPEDTPLPEQLCRIVEEVADVVSGYREQEQHIRQISQERARLQAAVDDHGQEISNRDDLIARYEFGEGEPVDEDQRLGLYRQAVALWEAGKDPSSIIAEVRELERVLLLNSTSNTRLMELLERHLEGLVKTLAQLRKIVPLTEDPKRFRSRLFASSPYDLKKLSGLMQAARDAARDLHSYVARARWAAGAEYLGKQFPTLRKIFKEMVRFVGDCRDKIGGPPPASCTISLETLDGLASLPSVLAVDVKALAGSRGVRGVAPQVIDILEETVSVFHTTLCTARGESIERSEAPKREAQTKAMARLADELISLAGLMESTFAEARNNHWRAQENERMLIEQEHLLQLGLRDVDAMTECLHQAPGAPEQKLNTIPGGKRSALDGLLLSSKDRVAWLEDIARYRVTIRD